MSAVSSTIRAHSGMHSEKSAISLSWKSPFQPRLARNRFRSGTQSDPCISSVTTSIMITGLSRHWRNLRGRSQPRRSTHHRSSLDCRGSSRETKTLQSSRNLPNVRPSLEPADDRTGDVAVVPDSWQAIAFESASRNIGAIILGVDLGSHGIDLGGTYCGSDKDYL